MTSTNKQYKSSVFSSFFNDEKRLIEVYNAIEGKSYPQDSEVEINTLENALYMDRGNDISFLLDKKLVILIEHQSTLNKNMPLRLLIYIGRLYEKILGNTNIYRSKLIGIPRPDFIVLYNGDDECPDKDVLKLSDAFEYVDIPDMLELTVNVYNINQGRNKEILQRSKSLGDYAAFIGRVKENKTAGLEIGAAVEEALNYCISNGIMKEYLESHSSEVRNMLFTEFNMDDALRIRFEEGMETGIEKGMEKGVEIGIEKGVGIGAERTAESIAVNWLRSGADPDLVSQNTGLSIDKILLLAKGIKQN
ncbi:MAG: hypothetical protein LBK57_06170 [Clostridiales Family XIII bacterium]|jgi:predicted transposase/invertase (TIGR01784 family)|nr:hypothetical protein [Clostridiales Family XIII bacterium]